MGWDICSMPIQREVLVGAIGVGAATLGCYFVYKQITRRYSLVEPGGKKTICTICLYKCTEYKPIITREKQI